MPRGLVASGKRKCFVYLIAKGVETVKIGRSATPDLRKSQLQVGASDELELIHAWPMKTAGAVRFEGDLHKLFKWARVSGEWHKVDTPAIIAVGDKLLAGDAEGAAHLAEAIRVEGAIMTQWLVADNRWTAARKRRDPEERDRCAAQAEDVSERLHEAQRAAEGLGRPCWWKPIGNIETKPKGRRRAA